MADKWEINANEPDLDEKYEWRLPDIDQEHVQETVAPGDLRIKPKDISLIPTNAPKQSGIQSGQDFWKLQVGVTSSWYIRGEILEGE